jgi:hypothetical protein
MSQQLRNGIEMKITQITNVEALASYLESMGGDDALRDAESVRKHAPSVRLTEARYVPSHDPYVAIRSGRIGGMMIGASWRTWTGRVVEITLAEVTMASGDEAALFQYLIHGDAAGRLASQAITLAQSGVRIVRERGTDL